MKKLKRYVAAILILVSYHVIDAGWRDWFNWTSWKNWWTTTRTNQLFLTQPEIPPKTAQDLTTATALQAFKDKQAADKRLEQPQGPTQPETTQPTEKQAQALDQVSIIPTSSPTQRKIAKEAGQLDQINDFLHEAYIFFSDVSQFYHTQYNKPNFDENFKRLTDAHMNFIKKLQGIKSAGVLDAIVFEFKYLIPIPWNYLSNIKTLIDNLESIDEKVKIEIQGDLTKSDPAFNQRLYEYGKQDITLDQIPREDQLKLLHAYRKYQIKTMWKNLYEHRDELIRRLKNINPKMDTSWISYYS